MNNAQGGLNHKLKIGFILTGIAFALIPLSLYLYSTGVVSTSFVNLLVVALLIVAQRMFFLFSVKIALTISLVFLTISIMLGLILSNRVDSGPDGFFPSFEGPVFAVLLCWAMSAYELILALVCVHVLEKQRIGNKNTSKPN